MESDGYRRMSSTTIYTDDIVRLHKLRRKRPNKRRYDPLMENNADVVGRALDALEALEKTHISK